MAREHFSSLFKCQQNSSGFQTASNFLYQLKKWTETYLACGPRQPSPAFPLSCSPPPVQSTEGARPRVAAGLARRSAPRQRSEGIRLTPRSPDIFPPPALSLSRPCAHALSHSLSISSSPKAAAEHRSIPRPPSPSGLAELSWSSIAVVLFVRCHWVKAGSSTAAPTTRSPSSVAGRRRRRFGLPLRSRSLEGLRVPRHPETDAAPVIDYVTDDPSLPEQPEKEICPGECTKVVPQLREDLGVLCASKTMNHQGKPECGLANGHRKSLWSMQASRMNLTRMCVMPILRTSYKISFLSTTN
ncbi:uncharacterized protein [Triticum aestivum]|uniref:uncharacterized protein n=1 Tax=Triticum aestivum TaxID=4565 RepID=UPI001D00A99B|nr:uncharacterized protein LOC123114930 [Triticum aestivum]